MCLKAPPPELSSSPPQCASGFLKPAPSPPQFVSSSPEAHLSQPQVALLKLSLRLSLKPSPRLLLRLSLKLSLKPLLKLSPKLSLKLSPKLLL